MGLLMNAWNALLRLENRSIRSGFVRSHSEQHEGFGLGLLCSLLERKVTLEGYCPNRRFGLGLLCSLLEQECRVFVSKLVSVRQNGSVCVGPVFTVTYVNNKGDV